jgi:hypothetical protein
MGYALYSVVTGAGGSGASADQVALVAATNKTILEIFASSTDRVLLKQWWIEFDGTSAAAAPVKVELCRSSAAITGTAYASLAAQPKVHDFAVSATATARYNATVEGTVTDVMEVHRIPPTGGLVMQYPLGGEITGGASTGIRIRCNAPAAVNATAGFMWEE